MTARVRSKIAAAAVVVAVAGGLGAVVVDGSGGAADTDGVVAASRGTSVRPVAPTAAPRLYPLPTRPVKVRPCVPRSGPGAPPPKATMPVVPAHDLPRPLPVAKRKVDLGPVTGKGMWMTTWADAEVDVPAVVTQARAAGLRQLWVRTGGTRQGWYGTELLTALLPAAHEAGLAVVAWDFPMLRDPVADAERAGLAIRGTFAGHRIDAFSPDIETGFEGTMLTERRVRLYLSHVRRAAGDMPVVATVMRPTASQLASYPYRAQVPYVDAFAPMVYWSCNEPGRLARESMRALAKLRPVHLIGQSYDMGDAGGPRGVPPSGEIWRFLDVADRSGAVGASLYNSDGAGPPQWKALGRYPWRWAARAGDGSRSTRPAP